MPHITLLKLHAFSDVKVAQKISPVTTPMRFHTRPSLWSCTNVCSRNLIGATCNHIHGICLVEGPPLCDQLAITQCIRTS
jgi:hypothetical protein